ncbi:hypothetical protein V5O48_017521, partial [Marasmius crinis-equi]
LVLGLGTFVGGIKFSQQAFDYQVSQAYSVLLAISIIAIILPLVLHSLPTAESVRNLEMSLEISHGYISHIFYSCSILTALGTNFIHPITSCLSDIETELVQLNSDEETGARGDTGMISHISRSSRESLEEEVEPQLSLRVTIGLFLITTGGTAFTCELLAGSINNVANPDNLSPQFIGVFLLRFASNIGDNLSAILSKNLTERSLTLTMSASIGASLQIALFIMP